jgi:hypothetical protein
MTDGKGNKEIVDDILARGAITAEDVLKLRKQVFWKGVVTFEDAETAFALNDKLGPSADPSWASFFVEALTDYLVMQAKPEGYVSEENAAWLIEHIARSGRVDTETELELLVKIMERGKSSPVRLVAFALDQVKWGVLEGSGFVGHNRQLRPGVIGEAEVELVRRVLYAFGGDGNIAVTRQEAEILFDINDATAEAENDPAWSDLFVKAIANFLMATFGYQVPTRQEALRREEWLDAPTPGIAGFMSQMVAGSLNAIWDAYENRSIDGEPRKKPSSGLSFDDQPRATDDDIRFVIERIGRDHRLHENEEAMINFLKSRGAQRFPKLRPILDLAAA